MAIFAIDETRRELGLGPLYLRFQRNLGEILWEAGEKDAAIDLLLERIRHVPDILGWSEMRLEVSENVNRLIEFYDSRNDKQKVAEWREKLDQFESPFNRYLRFSFIAEQLKQPN